MMKAKEIKETRNMSLAQHKLPIKTKIITKEVETEIGGE